MANVNITPTLRQMIELNVCKPFDEQYKLASVMTEQDSVMFYDKYLVTPEQAKVLPILPSAWVSVSHRDSFKEKVYVAHKPKDGVANHWLKLTLPATERYYLYAWTYEPAGNTLNTEKPHHYWFASDLQDAGLSKDYITPLKQIVLDRAQTVSTVNKMLDGCSTLNQVAKIWPAITKYVDKDVIDRMNRRAVRKTAANLNLDPEAMNKLSIHHIRQQMTS